MRHAKIRNADQHVTAFGYLTDSLGFTVWHQFVWCALDSPGRSHDSSFTLFRVGEKASEGMQNFAESGRSEQLDEHAQVKSSQFQIITYLSDYTYLLYIPVIHTVKCSVYRLLSMYACLLLDHAHLKCRGWFFFLQKLELGISLYVILFYRGRTGFWIRLRDQPLAKELAIRTLSFLLTPITRWWVKFFFIYCIFTKILNWSGLCK